MPAHVVTPDELVDPATLIALNDPDDLAFYRKLVRDMKRRGWRGRPLLATKHQGECYAITGSHRIAAAMEAGIKVPVVWWEGARDAAYCGAAVSLYVKAARDYPSPDPVYQDERVWWLLRMEGQSFIRNGG